jgi:hypothetical protein
LREPHRLRPWLCGIARNLARNAFRSQAREPLEQPLETAGELPSPERPPSAQAIGREEEAIVWGALQKMPDLYREPLILFYREGCSVAAVARLLDISENAVKQRLSRGREMLRAETEAVVEGALRRSRPGRALTLVVMAGLPGVVGSSAKAGVAVAGTAAKAIAGAKAATTVGLAGAVLGPLAGILGGVIGARSSIRSARSPRERRFVVRQTWFVTAYVLLFVAAAPTLRWLGRRFFASSPILFTWAEGTLWVAYLLGLFAFSSASNRRQRQIQAEDGTAPPLPVSGPRFASRRQQLWIVYGTLGGSTAGALAWIVIQAIRCREWTTAASTVLVGVAVVLSGGRALVRQPGSGFRVMVRAVAVLVLFALVVCLAHRRDPSWARAARGLSMGNGETLPGRAELRPRLSLLGSAGGSSG